MEAICFDFTRKCRFCNAIIGFFEDQRSENSTRIPFDLNGTRHRCIHDTYFQYNSEQLVLNAIEYVRQINRLLKGCYLRIERLETRA